MDSDELEPEMSHTSGNGSGCAPPQESQTLVIEPPGSGELADGKPTGPRTEQGKQRSSRNATKHGVFSKVIILKGESRDEYEELLAGLHESLQPEGTLEELLVENLAVNIWRRRRLLQAENAEISENMKLDTLGLISTIDNPVALKRCKELLNKLWTGLQSNGFDKEPYDLPLKTIYGDPDRPHLRKTLQDEYSMWRDIARVSETERARRGYATPEQCKMNVLRSIGAEIKRLEEYEKKPESSESEQTNLEILRQSVPDSRVMDLFLRYEAHLSREFDRTLAQLERLQRMRLGQPVLPKLEVRHSLS